MNVYISGISGTGMGPLALMAKQAGMNVSGSDLSEGAVYGELKNAGIDMEIGVQDGKFLKKKLEQGVDWFVYTSALPEGHDELILAKDAGIKCTKRDDFTAYLVDELGLKMVAVAGTHGKTTTTAMIIWVALKLRLPVAYIVGTTLGFAPSGAYHSEDKFFVYEADEYDRNFLKYYPWIAVVTTVSYDHPDIYPTKSKYVEAFEQFEKQSETVIESSSFDKDDFKLAGEVRRGDAALAAEAILKMNPELQRGKVIEILNEFPGVGRRFERIADGVYTDYAHHPEEIAATIDVAKDEAKKRNKKGVVVVYQPHQNTRQYEVREGYRNVFEGVDKIFWLPTYLTREDPNLPILTPEELITGLNNKELVEVVNLGDNLVEKVKQHVGTGYLVILMTAGPADGWWREHFASD
ncbi:MAG: Mur ligase domain-containing protein [Candidatus Saccharimonadaceae bacterium]|nr:Mur ligase domain-containing protein [Candidatus Saccharimonadaceae bacterium]